LQRLIDRTYDRRTFEAVARVRAFTDRLGLELPMPGELRDVLASVLRDPDLDLAFALPDGRLVDSRGTPREVPADSEQLVVTSLPGRSGVCGYVVHRRLADADAHLFGDVMQAASTSLEHARLQAELCVQLAAVEASRARVVEAADAERRRVERDLHDGAQQQLVALALSLRSEQRRLGRTLGSEALQLIDGTVNGLRDAVDELRALAHGLVPAALASEGLGPALVELVARQAGVVILLEIPAHRHLPMTEATAWFVACEGLTNAAKHAVGADMTLAARCCEELLTVSVSDTGPGGAALDAGSGLRGLSDRVAACGGTLRLASTPGRGTVLTATIPCE
ncbi:MAG TPA: histidine kinase, partial [Acidimicrobiales bacterium]|nr:histidine kinase [Acidimicrobiales bacterium]